MDPTKGLGANGYQEIKSHPYFSNINFETLPQNKPPIIQPHKRTLRVRRETEERRAALASQKMSPWYPVPPGNFIEISVLGINLCLTVN